MEEDHFRERSGCKRMDESKAKEETDSLKTEVEGKKARWEGMMLWESTEVKQTVYLRQS